MKLIIVSVLIFLSIEESLAKFCLCGRENVNSRIVGGSVVSANRYPWMTFLRFQNYIKAWVCGGSLINDRYILTAAHCVSSNPTKILAYLGSNYARDGQEMEVSEIVEHVPGYNSGNHHYDIALLKLAEPVQFSSTISPICLPTPDMLNFTSLTVAGWGMTRGKGESSNILLEVTVNQTPFDECNRWRRYSLIDSQFCAADVGRDSCGGDSGGPLMHRQRGRMYVAGIVSYGSVNCGTDRMSVYTRVTSFLDWIQRETKDAEYCTF